MITFFQKNNKKKVYNFSNGFTLIELMVSISIFISIMLAAMGALIIASNGAKEAKALRITMDNVNFAMENMTRSLRIGSKYNCGANKDTTLVNQTADCLSGNYSVGFTPAEDPSGRIAYQFVNSKLEKCVASNNCVSIISSNVAVDNVKFFVNGTNSSDYVAPSVYMILSGSVTIKGKVTRFSVQTMAAQRSNE